LPIVQYNFINDGEINEMGSGAVKHIGPTAQDFYKSFGLGAADTRIKATDMAGVALAGIKALNAAVGQLQTAGAILSVEAGTDAQCVTGDTRLRRRRKRVSPAGPGAEIDNGYDEIYITDIAVGDEIASLDERTGRIVYSRVNALLDMGVQEIFELKTASGRTIRTTGNHPYLVRTAQKTV
jgi:hypothetical protein